MPKGPDVNDLKKRGLKVVLPPPPGTDDGDDVDDERRGGSQADRILRCCAGVRMVKASSGDTYAVTEPPYALPLRSKEFRLWLTHKAWLTLKTVPKPGNVDAAIGVLEGQAHNSESTAVFVRVGEADGCRFLDLGNAVIRITRDGWEVDPSPSVVFWRPAKALPMPMPTRGGKLSELRRFIRADDASWALVVMWLVAAMMPMSKGGAFPILQFVGLEGTAKTTAARFLRLLIDKSSEPIASPPTDRRDFVAFAKNDWVMNLDNISSMKADMMDDLCKVVTGIGFQQRVMYTNFEIATATVKRPVILNGIVDFTNRSDLLSRILRVELQPLGDGERRPDAEMREEFEALHPALLGALLDVVVATMSSTTPAQTNRRLADAEIAAIAAEAAAGLAPGSIVAALDELDEHRAVIALDGWAVWPVLQKLLAKPVARNTWSGTATELLETLAAEATQTARHSPTWPHAANTLSGQLSRNASAMKNDGVTVEYTKSGSTKTITITRRAPPTSVVVDDAVDDLFPEHGAHA